VTAEQASTAAHEQPLIGRRIRQSRGSCRASRAHAGRTGTGKPGRSATVQTRLPAKGTLVARLTPGPRSRKLCGLSNPFRSLTTMRYVPAGRRVTFLPGVVFRLMSNSGPVFAKSVVTAGAEAESARLTKAAGQDDEDPESCGHWFLNLIILSAPPKGRQPSRGLVSARRACPSCQARRGREPCTGRRRSPS